MRTTPFGLILFLLTALLNTFSYGQTDVPDTLKIKPSECPGLPPAIAAWLEQRGMVIPLYQFGEDDRSDNVLQGQFFKSGQDDWAVLTTDGDSLRVWVFPEGRTENPSLLVAESEKQKNWNSHWTLVDNKYTYGLFIRNLSPGDLASTTHFFGLPAALPAFDHQGIWYGIVDKPGRPTQYYYHCGVWMLIPLLGD